MNQGRIFELVELVEYSGPKILIYSVFMDSDEQTLFDNFLIENKETYPDEINDLVEKLKTIGNITGLKGRWQKPEEGSFGDGIRALFDEPDRNLRLYFILFANKDIDLAIVIGSGGPKPKGTKALQETDKIKDENYLLRDIAAVLNNKWIDGELKIDDQGFYIDNDDDENYDLIFKI